MVNNNQALLHYGVKGMKWGVRKARQEYRKLDTLKGQYKHAKKAYDRSWNYAVNTPGANSSNRVKRAQADARWDDAKRDAARVKQAKADYKEQKKSVRKNAPIAAKLERGAKAVGRGMAAVGGLYVADQLYFGGAGTRAAKAAASTGAKAAKAAVSTALREIGDQMFDYSILDAAGNVIRRYN